MNDAALAEENARLKARLAETEAALAEALEARRRLESIVAELRRERFGAKSEKLDPEQFNLPLEGEPSRRHRFEPDGERDRAGHPGGGAGEGPPCPEGPRGR